MFTKSSLIVLLSALMAVQLQAKAEKGSIIGYNANSDQVEFLGFKPRLEHDWSQANVEIQGINHNKSNAVADVELRPNFWIILLDISDTGRNAGIAAEIKALIEFLETLPDSHHVRLIPFAFNTFDPRYNFRSETAQMLHMGSYRTALIAWLKNLAKNRNWQKTSYINRPADTHKQLNNTLIATRVGELIAESIEQNKRETFQRHPSYKVLLLTDGKDEDEQNKTHLLAEQLLFQSKNMISTAMGTSVEFYIISEQGFENPKDRKYKRNRSKLADLSDKSYGYLLYDQMSNKGLSELQAHYLASSKQSELEFDKLNLGQHLNIAFDDINKRLLASPDKEQTLKQVVATVRDVLKEDSFSLNLTLSNEQDKSTTVKFDNKTLAQLCRFILNSDTKSAKTKIEARSYLVLYYLSINDIKSFLSIILESNISYNVDITLILEITINTFLLGEYDDWSQWEVFRLAMILVENQFNKGLSLMQVAKKHPAASLYYAQLLDGEKVDQVKLAKVDRAKAIKLMANCLSPLAKKHRELLKQANSLLIAIFREELANPSVPFDVSSLKLLCKHSSEAHWIFALYHLNQSSTKPAILSELALALKSYLEGQANLGNVKILDEHKHAYTILTMLTIPQELMPRAKWKESIASVQHVINTNMLISYAEPNLNIFLDEASQIAIAKMLADVDTRWRTQIEGIRDVYRLEAALIVARYYYQHQKRDEAIKYYQFLRQNSYPFYQQSDIYAMIKLGLIISNAPISEAMPEFEDEGLPINSNSALAYALLGAAGASLMIIFTLLICRRIKQQSSCLIIPSYQHGKTSIPRQEASYLQISYQGETMLCCLYSKQRVYSIGSSPHNDIFIPCSGLKPVHSIVYHQENGACCIASIPSLLQQNSELTVTVLQAMRTVTMASFKVTLLTNP